MVISPMVVQHVNNSNSNWTHDQLKEMRDLFQRKAQEDMQLGSYSEPNEESSLESLIVPNK